MNSSQNQLFAKLLTAAIIAIGVLGISLSNAQTQDKGPHIDRGVRWSAGNIPSFEEQQKMEQFYRERVYPHQEADRRQYEEAEREFRSKSEEYDRRLAELELMHRGLAETEAKASKQEQKTALKYRLAAEKEIAVVRCNIGASYYHGEGVPQDYAEAAKWFRLAAEQGLSQAQYNLGVSYADGKGVPKDDAEAAKWYRLAAEQGDAEAQYELGLRYLFGQGVPQNEGNSVKWFRLAAEHGDAEAQYHLGLRYAIGNGVPQDKVLAYMWHDLASANGLKRAERKKGQLEKRLTRQQITEAQKLSREWKPKG